MMAEQGEKVHHPLHYGGADNPYEVIKVLQHWLTPEQYVGFCLGNTIKYQARARHKGQSDTDLKKAEWYQHELNRFLKDGPIKLVLKDQGEQDA
jgi:hypothetical protein